jgi:hypothetical protein
MSPREQVPWTETWPLDSILLFSCCTGRLAPLAMGRDASTILASVPVGTVFRRHGCVGVIQVERGSG